MTDLLQTPADPHELTGSRVQLALNVSDLDEAVAYYSKLFGTQPHKRRPGYANFAVADPPLKLVLVEVGDSPHAGNLNHVGVEVDSADAVAGHIDRLSTEGIAGEVQESNLCCHAIQDKVWSSGPDGVRWEIYTILDDDPTEDPATAVDACCLPDDSSNDSSAPCCS